APGEILIGWEANTYHSVSPKKRKPFHTSKTPSYCIVLRSGCSIFDMVNLKRYLWMNLRERPFVRACPSSNRPLFQAQYWQQIFELSCETRVRLPMSYARCMIWDSWGECCQNLAGSPAWCSTTIIISTPRMNIPSEPWKSWTKLLRDKEPRIPSIKEFSMKFMTLPPCTLPCSCMIRVRD